MWEVKCEVSYQSIRNSESKREREGKSECMLGTARVPTPSDLSAPPSACAQLKYNQAAPSARKQSCTRSEGVEKRASSSEKK